MTISQREAKRISKKLIALESALRAQRRAWSQEYFGAIEIGRCSWTTDQTIPTAIRTARKLKHAVVVVGDETGTIRFMALPHSSEEV